MSIEARDTVIGNIKDRLNNQHIETVSLTPGEVQFIKNMGAIFQRNLDELQNHFATEYLRQVAISRLGYNLDDELQFKFEPNKYKDNLQIMKVTPES